MKNILKSMQAGELIAGTFVVSASPSAVEIAGYSGADFVVIDCEHAALSPYGTELESCVRAAYAADITPVVRITSKEGGQVLKATNFGAHALLIPHVNTAEQAAQMVSYARIPPMGNRSCAPPVRAARHGWEDFPDFAERSNQLVEVIPILEEPAAFENLDEILAVEGINIVNFGPYDLAARLGGVGDPGAEAKVDEYLEQCLEACERHDVMVLDLCWNVPQARHQVEKGCHGVIYSTDVSLLNSALKSQFSDLRQNLGEVQTAKAAA